MGLVTVDGKLVLVEGKPIDVPSSVELQEKSVTITENGTVEVVPDTGKALSKVTAAVNVPSSSKEEQEKTAGITENGTTEVMPDAGKTLSKVTVNVAVPSKEEQEKTVTVTGNGTTEINPDSGKVLSKATVVVNVPSSSKEEEEGEFNIGENGMHNFSPDEGKVFSSVVVNVDVPTYAGNLWNDGEPHEINFYDYDGTLVETGSLEELAAATALPELPNHELDGLVGQGWNWTLADLKAWNRKMDVGAMYTTFDGATRIYIHLEEGRTSPMLGCCPNGTVEVDWGDGSEPDTLTGTSTASVKWTPVHNYDAPGYYTITLTVNGTVGFGGATTANQYAYLLRQSADADGRNMHYLSCIRRIEFGNNVALQARALMYCSGLQCVTMPQGIDLRGSTLFQNCAALGFLTVPSNVTAIGSDNFRSCANLKAVSLPKGVTTIGASAFLGNTLLRRVRLPGALTAIQSNAFYQCCSLPELFIPPSVTAIQANAFINAYGVKVYDFTAHTAVPTLANANAFTGIAADCQIRVPSALADVWRTATNWATYEDYIMWEV